MENKDLDIIYEQLKDKYCLVLTNAFALNDGYEIDVPVLCGKSVFGRFHLYKEDADWHEFVFSVEYAQANAEEKHTHWHPQSREEALGDVIAFMDGTHKYCLSIQNAAGASPRPTHNLSLGDCHTSVRTGSQ